MQLDDRLASLASGDKPGRPVNEQAVVRVWPSPSCLCRQLNQALRRCAQSLRFDVPRPTQGERRYPFGVQIEGERSSTDTRDRAIVLGCAIDRLNMAQTVARVQAIVEQGVFAQQVSINAAKLVTLKQDTELREVVNRCELVNADGQSVVWASRLLGDPLPERVAGIDLMHALIAMATREDYGIYILGARQEVLETAVQRLRQIYPSLRIAGYRHGYFSEEESPQVAEAIRRAGAQILFVAMSSPRKEHWLGEHGPALGMPFAMGVGGSIDIVAGVTRRAPRIWQRLGIEWFYRLLQEPRRMFRRYLVTNTRFGVLVARAMAARVFRCGPHQAE
jgi:N-acetylglucosaminyldiphosphoundecaprenol N-acetyl-beta-D-mannosaminyltransferase